MTSGRWSVVGRLQVCALRCLLLTGFLVQAAACGVADPEVEDECLNPKAYDLVGTGQYAKAVPIVEELLADRIKRFGDETVETARCLDTLSFLLSRSGQAKSAVALAEKALEIFEHKTGPMSAATADALNTLAFVHFLAGRFELAEPYFVRSHEILIKPYGRGHLKTVTSLTNLGHLREVQGRLQEARSYLEESLAIVRREGGDGTADICPIKINLAGVLEAEGDLKGARVFYAEVLSIRLDTLGATHPDTARSYGDLGRVLLAFGKVAEARSAYEKALEIVTALDPHHPDRARYLSGLGSVFKDLGNDQAALSFFEEALELTEKIHGPEHPNMVVALTSAGAAYQEVSNPERAEKCHERALVLSRKLYGERHPEVASVLNNLASVRRGLGKSDSARALFEEALSIREEKLDPTHPDLAVSLTNLGSLLKSMGDLPGAEVHYERALQIRLERFGASHPETAKSFSNLAVVKEALGDIETSVKLTLAAVESNEVWMDSILTIGTEDDKRLFLETLKGASDRAVSLSLGSGLGEPSAIELALTVVLRQKGRALEATAEGYRRREQINDPEAATLQENLGELRAKHVALLLGRTRRPDWRELRGEIERVESEIARIETKLAERGAANRQTTTPIALEAVQAALPTTAALVELIIFQPFDAKATENPWGESRYAAYVLRSSGPPAAVDLGPARQITDAVRAFREVLADPRADFRSRSIELDAHTMAKIRPLLSDAQELVLSPDGELNLVPFAALMDSSDQYLIEKYQLSYLGSGRDLLLDKPIAPSREPPLIVGGPDFDMLLPSWSGADASVTPRDQLPARFEPLRYATAEAEEIGKILGLDPSRVLIGSLATEAAVKSARGPRFLHLATHGFFLPGVFFPAAPSIDLLPDRANETSIDAFLRSGLAMTGFNRRGASKDSDDGVLTALEVLALDLRGTEVVILSACETGLGKVRNGEGIFGLRRAFELAGARNQMMTLWQVDDLATRQLITSWYKQFLNHVPGAEALRQAQLAALRDNPLPETGVLLGRGSQPVGPAAKARASAVRHPYYWASFLFIGPDGPGGAR